MIFNALMKSQFSYFPLAWMFCSRLTKNMIIHEKALNIVLNDYISNFETMHRNMNDITFHHRNIQLLIELFKIKYDLFLQSWILRYI